MKLYHPFVFAGFFMFILFILDLINNQHFDLNLFLFSIGMVVGISLWIDDYKKEKFLRNAIDWI